MASTFLGSPGSFGTDQKTLSPVTVQGIPVDALGEAIRLNNLTLATTRQADRFWSTPERLYNDPHIEVMEVKLTWWYVVSKIEFEMARFPSTITIEYWDESQNSWLPVLDKTGLPVVHSISDSLPTVFGATAGLTHPQHYGNGHWVRVAFDLTPQSAMRWRFKLQRTAPGRIIAPRTARNQQAAYSLGLRNLNLAQAITYKLDVPYRPPISVTERDTFTSSVDLLGSTVTFAMRENRADALLSNGIWKSEPQPISNAVVNLYADVREPDGSPQVMDRLYLDPLYSGGTVNLYYSTQVPSGDFAADDDALLYPRSQLSGRVTLSANDGATFYNEFGYIEINNGGGVVGFDPTQDWWYGEAIQLNNPPASTQEIVIADFGPRVTVVGRTLTASFGDAVLSLEGVPDAFVLGLIYRDGEFFLTLGDPVAEDDGALVRVGSVTPASVAVPLTMRWGAKVGTEEIGIGFHRMLAAVLKQETYDDDDHQLGLFAFFPQGYLQATGRTLADPTRNALLRFSPTHIATENPDITGFVGGPGDIYGEIVWTPIHRDYIVAKGFLNFPPVKARFLKLEFTHLTAQPYTATQPIKRTVKIFATATPQDNGGSATLGTRTDTGALVNQGLGALKLFPDDDRAGVNIPSEVVGGVSPTETLYSPDPTANADLRSSSSLYGFTAWAQPRGGAPRHILVDKHSYETVEIEHKNKVAYFAGLHGITFYRRDYTAADDTERYDFHFLDDTAIDFTAAGAVQADGTEVWTLDDGLNVPTDLDLSAHNVLASQVLNSQRSVRGIQFATVQTPPRQLLPDDDFDDPFLLHWEPIGDVDELRTADQYTSTIGSTVEVSRTLRAKNWSELEGYSWNDIEALVMSDDEPPVPTTTWGDLDGTDPSGSSAIGGLQSEFVSPSAAGRLYLAVRVIAPTTLNADLLLQLVAEDETILATEPVPVQAGQVGEFTVGVTIGETSTRIGRPWTQMEQEFPDWDAVEGRAWYDLDTQLPNLQQRVRARLIQNEPTGDTWYVDTLSLYDDPIVWEFSRDGGITFYRVFDIKNDPHGVFLFPETNSTTAVTNKLVWRVNGFGPNLNVNALFIRPWYADLGTGISHREGLSSGGPNASPTDHFPPIGMDPAWQVWADPVPIDWWFFFRQRFSGRYGSAPTITPLGYGTWAVPSGHTEPMPAGGTP